MNIFDYFHDKSTLIIVSGYVDGGYEELRKKYPQRLDEINNEVEKSFCKESIDNYSNSMISGLKKVGYWKEKTS